LPEELSKALNFFPEFRKIDLCNQKVTVEDVALSFASGVALCKDVETGETRLFGWGNSEKGQVGYGGTLTQYLPIELTDIPKNITQIAAGSFHVIVKTEDDRMFGWGKGSRGQLGFKYEKGKDANIRKVPTEIKLDLDNKSIARISCGSLHTVAMIN
jgi:alpha-tubulin suppressor-like RCC1 family protein